MKLRSLLFLTLGVFMGGMSVLAAPDRVPCVISDDFETGELCGWESYPYAQDIGYEPWTVPQKYPAHNNSRYSIAKIQKPNDIVELSEGFTKQMDLWTTSGTRMKCAVFLMSDRKPADLELSICLFDGRRYLHHVQSPVAAQWVELDIPLSQFTLDGKALKSGSHVQAVTVKAFYPVVSQLMSYTICLDDFSLNGERPRRFIGVNPSSTMFEMFGFSILNKHFFYTDTIGITVKPEDAPGASAVSGVKCDVIDSQGRKVVSGASMTASGGAWLNDKIYTIKRTDPRGQWTINFTGKDASGKEVAWGFRFLMPGERLTAANYPRLLFSEADMVKIKADTSPNTKTWLASFIAGPDGFKDIDLSRWNESTNESLEALTGGPFSIIKEGGNWWEPIDQIGRVMTTGAERYAVTGDEVAGRKAKEAMLKLCAFSLWNHPWEEAHGNHSYYPQGDKVVGPVAKAYELLYPLLTDADKRAVRRGIMENALKPFYRDMVELNRMPSSLSNHIAILVSGMIKAATAIYGEDPENPYMEPYLSGVMAKMKQYIDRSYYPDGGYAEPTTYQDMATRDLMEGIDVLNRNFGVDYGTTTPVKDTWKYPLYVTHSNTRYPDFGDVSLVYPFNGNVFRWLSYRTKNPWTYYYTKLADEAPGKGRKPNFLNILWKAEGVTPRSRDEFVPSRMFPNKGNMVMRSDWADSGSIMVFKAGPNSNHYHADQGTFSIMTNGESLLDEAGHGSGYYTNLFYPCYYTQPIGHNCMLIDGDAESQVPADYENGVAALRNYPRMLHSFGGWSVDETTGDLTCVYKGKVQNYTRSLLYVKPGIVFLYDTVKSGSGHTYSWLFHAEHTNGKSSISGGKNSVDITRTKSSLHMDILAPKIESSRLRNSDRDESFITLSGARGTTDTEFLAVLFPRPSKDAPADKPSSTLLNPAGWTGAKIEQGGTTTIALFRNGSATGTAEVEGFSTDAERFSAVTGKGGNLATFFLRGSSFAKAGKTLFQSAKPVSASGKYVPGGMDVETETDSGAEISVNTGKAPQTVTVNGQAVKKFKYAAKTGLLTVSVPSGHTVVTVR